MYLSVTYSKKICKNVLKVLSDAKKFGLSNELSIGPIGALLKCPEQKHVLWGTCEIQFLNFKKFPRTQYLTDFAQILVCYRGDQGLWRI